MTDVVLCPNCGGSKTVSKPSYIAADINTWWSGGTTLYPCPTCNGKGWIDTEVDSDFEVAKGIALSVMSTSETLMDECVKRGDKIKELECRARVAEDQLRVAKEMRDELLEDWESKRSDVVRLQTIVHELESKNKELRDESLGAWILTWCR